MQPCQWANPLGAISPQTAHDYKGMTGQGYDTKRVTKEEQKAEARKVPRVRKGTAVLSQKHE